MNFFIFVGNFILIALAWAMTYTGLPVEPAAILGILMGIDFIAGVGAARKLGLVVSSQRMRVGVISKFGVLTIPLVMALTAKGLGADLNWLVNWSISLFILSESYSIIANIYAYKTGKVVPEFDAVAAVLKRVRGLLDNFDKREN